MMVIFCGESEEKEYLEYIEETAKHTPVQYILGCQEFMKLKFMVNENVLIPRHDTEILVEEAIEICKKNKCKKILDLCTGSGIIAITMSKILDGDEVYAGDISRKALDVAKYNNKNLRTRVNFIETDMFKNISGKFDMIVSNPPYIKTNVLYSLDMEVQKEPKIALDGGFDGLTFYKEIINNAYKFLNDNGFLALEIGFDQKLEVTGIIKRTNKYDSICVKKDLAGLDRVVVCKKRSEK